jgi:hypothetical protein
MRRLTFGALATAALALAIAVPAWANHGGDADPPGADIVPENEFGDVSSGGYIVDPAKRAFVQVALAAPSLTGGFYVVAIYDNDGDMFPIAGEIIRGDGSTTALQFDGPGAGDEAQGIDVSRATDDTIYVCALTIYRGRVRDLAGYTNTGQCSTAAGAMELSAGGISPGGTTFN